jgi:TonB family protein
MHHVTRILLPTLAIISLLASTHRAVGEAPAPGPDRFSQLQQPAQPVGGMEALVAALSYPDSARREGLQGEVRLQVAIDAAGTVRAVDILLPLRADLDSAAVRAVRACSWRAATGPDGPVPCQVVLPIQFQLAEKARP